MVYVKKNPLVKTFGLLNVCDASFVQTFKYFDIWFCVKFEIVQAVLTGSEYTQRSWSYNGVTYMYRCVLYVTWATVPFAYLGGIATPGGTLKQSPCACLGPWYGSWPMITTLIWKKKIGLYMGLYNYYCYYPICGYGMTVSNSVPSPMNLIGSIISYPVCHHEIINYTSVKIQTHKREKVDVNDITKWV